MGLQMDFFPPSPHHQLLNAKSTFVDSVGGGGGYCTVYHGSCADNMLLFSYIVMVKFSCFI